MSNSNFFVAEAFDNHQAEFMALYCGIYQALKLGLEQDPVWFYRSDSQVVIDAVNKGYVKKDKYKLYLDKALALIPWQVDLFAKWVAEKDNQGADQVARQALHHQGQVEKFEG